MLGKETGDNVWMPITSSWQLRSILPFQAPHALRSTKKCVISWRDFIRKSLSFHFGLPDKNLLRHVRKTGAKILSSATSVSEARWLEDQGCDAIIAQGFEAFGGHGECFSRRIFLHRSARWRWCRRWSTL